MSRKTNERRSRRRTHCSRRAVTNQRKRTGSKSRKSIYESVTNNGPYSYAFVSNNTFLKVSRVPNKKTKFILVAVPYDGSVTNRPGARYGPSAIREASMMLCDAIHPTFNISPINYTVDIGDINVPITSIDAMRKVLEKSAISLINKTHNEKQLIWLGGDHSITLSLLRAYNYVFKQPIGLIHFDAHSDAWADLFGEKSDHGTWVYEATQEKLIDPKYCVQIGLRSSGAKKTRTFIQNKGGLVFTAQELRGLENREQLASIIKQIISRFRSRKRPVYISFDIDCLDPAFAPGTGTPEPAGLSTNQVMTLFEELVYKLNLIGMDCVEVSPLYDHTQLTSQAAAYIVWTYMCATLSRLKKRKVFS